MNETRQSMLHLIGAIAGITAALVAIVGTVLAGFAYIDNTYAKKNPEEIKELIKKYESELKKIKDANEQELQRIIDKHQKNIEDIVANSNNTISNYADKIERTELETRNSLVAISAFQKEAENKAKLLIDEWHGPKLDNGWIPYDSGYNPPGYFKDIQGIVHLRGLLKNGKPGTNIFILPKGYRPSNRVLHPVITHSKIGRVDVFPKGGVVGSDVSSAWVSLDGISFKSAQ